MRSPLPRQPHRWLLFGFFLYWPTMAALVVGLIGVSTQSASAAQLARSSMEITALVSAIVALAGLAALLPRAVVIIRDRARRRAPLTPSPLAH